MYAQSRVIDTSRSGDGETSRGNLIGSPVIQESQPLKGLPGRSQIRFETLVEGEQVLVRHSVR